MKIPLVHDSIRCYTAAMAVYNRAARIVRVLPEVLVPVTEGVSPTGDDHLIAVPFPQAI